MSPPVRCRERAPKRLLRNDVAPPIDGAWRGKDRRLVATPRSLSLASGLRASSTDARDRIPGEPLSSGLVASGSGVKPRIRDGNDWRFVGPARGDSGCGGGGGDCEPKSTPMMLDACDWSSDWRECERLSECCR